MTEFRGDKEKSALCSALCNNGSSPTELALDAFAGNSEKLRTLYPRIKEIPFDSDKKYMVTAHRNGEGFLVLMKGAPDVVKRFCADFPESAVSQTASMASRALRVLCLAGYETKKLPHDLTSQKYTFYGLCGISDPPRPEAAEAVKTCRKAGIRTVMLTGDHPATALAVATELGISPPGGRVCTGSEISAMDEREFRRAVKECSVFARVAPAHKLRVVTALKALGNVVAMTGDGVNDAPALKKADIGCAMGISGTEVAKESADMVLTDDNFATVVSAVREGRGIYENIRRAVHFLLSCNIGELLTVFFSILLNFPSPLSAIQLLWVNLTTDSLPAIALGLEKTPDSVMERPPVKPGTPLFPAARTLRVILEGALIGGLAISAFMIGSGKSFAAGRTMCFLVLSMSQLFHSFNMRSEKSVFSRDVKRNPFVWLSFFVCLAMQLLVLLIPALSSMFGVVPLDPFEWIISFALSAAPLAAGEIYKLFKKR
ncbi:MAG: HAD-IC family P-type ATPase [Clostridia bacterium]|nr:HAD-IC family P-type ATPase [Clostridia bacterium]